MRLTLTAFLACLLLPGTAVAGPEGSYHVKGVNPDDGSDYTGTVKVVRKGELYAVTWQIGSNATTGTALGLRVIDGRVATGPAGDDDTGIAVSYVSGDTIGNATYAEHSDGTWHGSWAHRGARKVSTEEWIPMVRQIRAKLPAVVALPNQVELRRRAATPVVATADADDSAYHATPVRTISSPLPARAGPKS
ncbi:MAG: hypothetical protein KL863_14955 [Rhizobium sp.]|nr:hypothetical protein [Rhizobium sp.]